MADDRTNFPDRFKDSTDFIYETKPNGELEDPRETAWRRERQGLPISGISEEAAAPEPEPSELSAFDAGPEGTPTPEDTVGYHLRRKDVEFDGILQAMQLHASLPGNEWESEQLSSNPKYFNHVFDKMKKAAGGRFKPFVAGTYVNGKLVSPSEPENDPEPPAPSEKAISRLKDQIRNGRTPRERAEAEQRLIDIYLKGGR